MRPVSSTSQTHPLFLLGAATCAFIVLRTAGTLLAGQDALIPVSVATVLPTVVITMLACRAPMRSWALWVLALLCIPVVIRLTAVAGSWNLVHSGTVGAGALVGMYVLAAVRLGQPVTTEMPLVDGAWHQLVLQARNAQHTLVEELRLHALSGAMKQELTAQSQRLLQSVEKSAQMWSRLERNASPVLEQGIQAQLEGVEQMVRSASDEVAAREYQRTAEALSSQLDAVRRIRLNSDRAMARVRTQVTTMETARLSVMAYAAQDESVRSEDAQRLAQVLAKASEELDITAGALEEARV